MTAPPQAILTVERLCKAFGDVRAVDGVSFPVAKATQELADKGMAAD